MSRRDDVLQAAVHVVASRGLRGLTHQAVDQHGGLPAGTTSNSFRSRQALTLGTMEQLADMLAGIIGQVGAMPITTLDELAATLGQNLSFALGPGKEVGAALGAMFAEAPVEPALKPLLKRTNELWWTTIAEMLRGAGVDGDVEFRAKCLLSFGNGVAIDQLAVEDPDFDPVEAMRLAVIGFCS